jgi:hypothetical protein
MLSATYEILANIILSILTPHIGKITADHQSELQCNKLNVNHTFYHRQYFGQNANTVW